MTIKTKSLAIIILSVSIMGFSAAGILVALQGVNTVWDSYQGGAVFRLRQLTEIKSQFGYGGFIHNFKNYVLRGNPESIERFNHNRLAMQEAVAKLTEVTLTPEEVVAEKVRNLAIRSAEAAHSTSEIIAGTIAKVHEGSERMAGANQDFNRMQGHMEQVSGLMNEISRATREQTTGIAELNRAISEIDSVTQQNAAAAEDLAASLAMFRVIEGSAPEPVPARP